MLAFDEKNQNIDLQYQIESSSPAWLSEERVWAAPNPFLDLGDLTDCLHGGLHARAAARSGPAAVTLHVYDAGTSGVVKGLNTLLKPLGTGAFHCGVEVYDLEWSYSDTSDWGDEADSTGVFYSRPKSCEGHTYFMSLPLGSTYMAELEVLRLMERLEHEWPGDMYDVLEQIAATSVPTSAPFSVSGGCLGGSRTSPRGSPLCTGASSDPCPTEVDVDPSAAAR
eukprot:CAMPEP_0115311172 /NCGR_PEP_ID=MMETSP0270-20121206/75189_1 /TAXON_ID=71861 /ORGANISM="Scrippsiella trochoidea, Strain CCMP3099" /LENGTH=223 /DNA_ID=CAMNT_0002729977 /DNA_START=122 /DNA_END=792 /DNA_ORIENTATION=+